MFVTDLWLSVAARHYHTVRSATGWHTRAWWRLKQRISKCSYPPWNQSVTFYPSDGSFCTFLIFRFMIYIIGAGKNGIFWRFTTGEVDCISSTVVQTYTEIKPNCLTVFGLPVRGKTHIARRLGRYINWLGFNVAVFNFGTFRRKTLGASQSGKLFTRLN